MNAEQRLAELGTSDSAKMGHLQSREPSKSTYVGWLVLMVTRSSCMVMRGPDPLEATTSAGSLISTFRRSFSSRRRKDVRRS